MSAAAADQALLTGFRVLDFGRYIAGPYCAALLADLGAEVIRIEKLGGSEDRYICPVTDSGEGSLFLQLNRNKQSMTLDPMTEDGREVLRRLVRRADVVVANLPAPTLVEMGIDYSALCALRPDIILSSQSAFGDTGPYARRPGFDGVAQAMSGATWMSGREGAPCKSYASWCDFGTGMVAAFGTMAALMYRLKTGRGQQVKANLLRTALNVFHFNALEAYLTGRERQASGNRSQFGGPGDLFQTRDGWVQMQVIGQAVFERWCKLMGEAHWLTDPRFKTDAARAEEGALLSERTQTWIGDLTTAQALDRLAAARIPAGPLYSPLQTLDDPQVRAAGLLEWLEYPGLAKPAPIMRGPVEFSAFDTPVRSRPPQLGEHTDRVLSDLGYRAEEIAALRRKRAV